MKHAVCRTLVLGLWRDRGALVMSFVLPAIVFLVFAAILSGATGDELRLKVVIANEKTDPLAGRLAAALAVDRALAVVESTVLSAAQADAAVSAGSADAAIVIRRDGRALDDLIGDGPSPVLILTHPARMVAGAIVGGAVQRAYFAAVPDAALRGVVALVDSAVVELTPAQRAEADVALSTMSTNLAKNDGQADAGSALLGLVESQPSAHSRGALDQVTYYAAAVSALFVLLSAVHAASSIHDDRASGIVDRVVAGPAGTAALIDGRAIFLMGQGIVQALVIFGVAWATYARQWPGALWAWGLMTLALAAAAAGLTLGVACLCGSARQAQAASNVAILIAAAIGGSMVPRYLMPAWLQSLGWFSPNAWVIDGFTRALGPDPERYGSVLPASVLAAIGVVGWLVARNRAARWESE